MSFITHAITAVVMALITLCTGLVTPTVQTQVFTPSPSPATTTSSAHDVLSERKPTVLPKKDLVSSPPKIKPVVQTAPATPASASTAATAPETIVTPQEPLFATTTPWDAVNTRVRSAMVNVICTSVTGGLVNPISGSGVIIDPRGVILTNAHVAEYYLVKDYPTKDFLDCLVRQGSPASPFYRANLLYISPNWVRANYKDILEQTPLGTGEDDFALLLISTTTNPALSLPTSFPFIEPTFLDSQKILGEPVLITAYPAGFLGGASIQTSLYLSTAPASIQNIFTFSSSTVDLVSLGGSVVAQHGSSGGAVVAGDGKLMGLIVTSTDANTTSGRDLNAITLSYIDRELQSETSVGLSAFLSGDVRSISTEFNATVAPALEDLLVTLLRQATH